MIQTAIKTAFRKKRERGWDKWPKLFWAIDLHDVILPGTYTRDNENRKLYPDAQQVLQWLTTRKDMCIILYTSSHPDSIQDVLIWLKEQGIVFDYVNENPECPNNELCDFSSKFYMDILLEDKAGFEGKTDWGAIRYALIAEGEWFKLNSHEEQTDRTKI